MDNNNVQPQIELENEQVPLSKKAFSAAFDIMLIFIVSFIGSIGFLSLLNTNQTFNQNLNSLNLISDEINSNYVDAGLAYQDVDDDGVYNGTYVMGDDFVDNKLKLYVQQHILLSYSKDATAFNGVNPNDKIKDIKLPSFDVEDETYEIDLLAKFYINYASSIETEIIDMQSNPKAFFNSVVSSIDENNEYFVIVEGELPYLKGDKALSLYENFTDKKDDETVVFISDFFETVYEQSTAYFQASAKYVNLTKSYSSYYVKLAKPCNWMYVAAYVAAVLLVVGLPLIITKGQKTIGLLSFKARLSYNDKLPKPVAVLLHLVVKTLTYIPTLFVGALMVGAQGTGWTYPVVTIFNRPISASTIVLSLSVFGILNILCTLIRKDKRGLAELAGDCSVHDVYAEERNKSLIEEQQKFKVLGNGNTKNKTITKVLAIDLGASSGRTMVITFDGTEFTYEETYRFENRIIEEDGALKWDIVSLTNNVIAGVNESLKIHPDISSIGIDTWGVDYCYIKTDGSLLYPPYAYRDLRTDIASAQVLDIISNDTLYGRFGIQFAKFNTIFQLYDDFKNKKVAPVDIHRMLLMPDYFAYVLTGEFSMEITNASTMELLSLSDYKIDKETLKELNIPEHIFPMLRKPGQRIGYLKNDGTFGFFKTFIPVVSVCSHDTASAIFGADIDKESIFISSGTWSLLGVELESPNNSDVAKEENFTNEMGYNNHICFLKNIMGMFIVNELRHVWKDNGKDIAAKELTPLAASAKEIDSYINPDDESLSTPYEMDKKLINYLNKNNQEIPETEGEWLRVIYQSMACCYRYYIERLQHITGKEYKRIIVVGGGAKAAALNQMVANVTGMEILQGPVEATALGNGLAQIVALRRVTADEGRKLIGLTHNGDVYKPTDRDIWDKKYEKFLSISGLKKDK